MYFKINMLIIKLNININLKYQEYPFFFLLHPKLFAVCYLVCTQFLENKDRVFVL